MRDSRIFFPVISRLPRGAWTGDGTRRIIYAYAPKFWVGSPRRKIRHQETCGDHCFALSRNPQRHARGDARFAFGESERPQDVQDH